jgi:hypothetical protein
MAVYDDILARMITNHPDWSMDGIVYTAGIVVQNGTSYADYKRSPTKYELAAEAVYGNYEWYYNNVLHPPVTPVVTFPVIVPIVTYPVVIPPDDSIITSPDLVNVLAPPTYQYPSWVIDEVINGCLQIVSTITGEKRQAFLIDMAGIAGIVDKITWQIVTQNKVIADQAYELLIDANVAVDKNVSDYLGYVENTLDDITNVILIPPKSAIDKALGWLHDIIEAVDGNLNSAIESAGKIIAVITSAVGDTITITLDEAGNIIDSVVSEIENTINVVVHDAISFAGEFVMSLPSLVESSITTLASTLPKSITDMTSGISALASPLKALDGIKDGFKVMAEFARLVPKVTHAMDELEKTGELTHSPALTLAAKGLVSISATIGAFIGSPLGLLPFVGDSYAGGIGELVKKEARATYLPSVLDPMTLSEAYTRGIIEPGKFEEAGYQNGFSREDMAIIKRVREYMFSIADVGQLLLRDEMTGEEFVSRLMHIGVNASDLKYVRALIHPLPPLQDIIAMAVKEAFTPETVKLFGQDQDLPPDYMKYAMQSGLTEEWATRYWSAHWNLPSADMGFEMLQRGIIDRDTLKVLLKALDIMPYWRDRLIELSYSTVTRVDVRRLFKAGIYDYDRLLTANIAMGYSPQNAKDLADWTVMDVNGELKAEKKAQRELSKAEVLSVYSEAILARDDALSFMLDLGYDPEEAEMLLSLEDAKMQKRLILKAVEIIKLYCIDGLFTLQEAQDKFNEMGMTPNETAYHIMDLNLMLYKKGLTGEEVNA